MITKEEKRFKGWLWAIKLVGIALKVFTTTTTLSPEHWRVYYDEGFKADEALLEDFKYL